MNGHATATQKSELWKSVAATDPAVADGNRWALVVQKFYDKFLTVRCALQIARAEANCCFLPLRPQR